MSYREYLERYYGKFNGKYAHIKDGKVCWSGDELLRGFRCPRCREKLSFYKPGELGRELRQEAAENRENTRLRSGGPEPE